MRALFVGGPQHGAMLNLRESALYWDFPVTPKFPSIMSQQLPDEICKFDVIRYKCAMISIDRQSAIYTECGDAIDAMTRCHDWIKDMDPRTLRKPQPVFLQPKT